MSWLIAHAKAKRVLPRRQELPEEAFIGVEELKRLYGDCREGRTRHAEDQDSSEIIKLSSTIWENYCGVERSQVSAGVSRPTSRLCKRGPWPQVGPATCRSSAAALADEHALAKKKKNKRMPTLGGSFSAVSKPDSTSQDSLE